VELPDAAPDAEERLAAFALQPEAFILREREGKRPVRVDLKAAALSLVADGPRGLLFTLKAGEAEAVARPAELLAALFGAELVRPGVARLVREKVVFGAPRHST
jgi:hypothetical protein